MQWNKETYWYNSRAFNFEKRHKNLKIAPETFLLPKCWWNWFCSRIIRIIEKLPSLHLCEPLVLTMRKLENIRLQRPRSTWIWCWLRENCKSLLISTFFMENWWAHWKAIFATTRIHNNQSKVTYRTPSDIWNVEWAQGSITKRYIARNSPLWITRVAHPEMEALVASY